MEFFIPFQINLSLFPQHLSSLSLSGALLTFKPESIASLSNLVSLQLEQANENAIAQSIPASLRILKVNELTTALGPRLKKLLVLRTQLISENLTIGSLPRLNKLIVERIKFSTTLELRDLPSLKKLRLLSQSLLLSQGITSSVKLYATKYSTYSLNSQEDFQFALAVEDCSKMENNWDYASNFIWRVNLSFDSNQTSTFFKMAPTLTR